MTVPLWVCVGVDYLQRTLQRTFKQKWIHQSRDIQGISLEVSEKITIYIVFLLNDSYMSGTPKIQVIPVNQNGWVQFGSNFGIFTEKATKG